MSFLFAGTSGTDADSAISVLVEQIKGADAVGDQMELLTDAMVRLLSRRDLQANGVGFRHCVGALG